MLHPKYDLCECHVHPYGGQWLSCASPKMLYFLAPSKYAGQGGWCTPAAPCNWTKLWMHLSIQSYVSWFLGRLDGHSLTSSCQVHPVLPARSQHQASPAFRNEINEVNHRSMTTGRSWDSCVGKSEKVHAFHNGHLLLAVLFQARRLTHRYTSSTPLGYFGWWPLPSRSFCMVLAPAGVGWEQLLAWALWGR